MYSIIVLHTSCFGFPRATPSSIYNRFSASWKYLASVAVHFFPSVFHCLPMPSEFLDFTKPAPNWPALLFRKCISYKRAVIIACYYYNVSILVTTGFQDWESSVFFYISFRTYCFCLNQCFFTVLFSSTWIYILNILFLSKVIFTKMSLLFLGIITMTFSFFQIFYDFVIAFFV